MPLWKIAWRSIQHRSLASGLTAFSMGLGVALVVAVIVIHGVLTQTFMRSAQGYDIVVGPPKGSPLEIVLGAVFYSHHLSDTIPYSYFQQIETGPFSPEVETAIPIAIADRILGGMQVVATTPAFFTELRYLDRFPYTFRSGRNIGAGGDFEAVIGFTAARQTGLTVGDRFRASLSEHIPSEHVPEPDMFTVVGILDPTGTPNDQVIFVNLEGFFLMNNHARETAMDRVLDRRRGDQRISAVLVLTKDRDVPPVIVQDEWGMTQVHFDGELVRQDQNPLTMSLGDRLVRELDVQVARPTYEITRLFEMIVGRIQIVLVLFAVMVIIVAAIGMMVSIYNSMNERRQEIAIMRALGASRGTVMSIILLESILLSLGGGVIGVLIGHGLIAVVSPIIASAVMVVVNPWHFQVEELILIPGLIILASIVGYLPAVVAYRTDVAQSLNP